MTGEIIERVARAIYDDEFGEGAWVDLLASAKVHKLTRPTATERKYHQRARAAIEALREPTDAMVDAGWASANDENARDTWRDMVDECLK